MQISFMFATHKLFDDFLNASFQSHRKMVARELCEAFYTALDNKSWDFMSNNTNKKLGNLHSDVILEAIKGIKNEILLYGIVVITLLISSAYFGLEILKEIKWPLIILSTIILAFYAFVSHSQTIEKKKKTHSQTIEKKKKILNDFRLERIERIKAGDTPVLLLNSAKIVLHLVPNNAINSSEELDLSFLRNEKVLKPIYSENYAPPITQPNFDGLLSYVRFSSERSASSYVQIFHSGIIEAVDACLLDAKGDKSILQHVIEKYLVDGLRRYLQIQEKLSVKLPLFILLSYVGVREYKIVLPSFARPISSIPINRDDLLVPTRMIESFDCDIAEVASSIFDRIRNAVPFQGY